MAAAKKLPADPAAAPLLDAKKAARQTALKLLARRDFSSGELARRLAARGFNVEVITALIAALKQERLLSDERYLEHYVAYHAGRGQGPARIRRDLKKQGLDPEQLEAALRGKAGAQVDWLTRARELRRKKFGAALPDSYAEKAKQARFLQYRGFTGAQIRAVLDTDIDLDTDTDFDRDDT